MARIEKQPIHHKPVSKPAGAEPVADNFDSNDPVGDYMRQLQNIPLLTKEEEIILAQQIEEGKNAQKNLFAKDLQLSPSEITALREQSDAGFAAQEELIIKNRRLVVSIAKKYQGRGVMFMDLISEGNIALIRATNKYDLKRGARFSTYATWWIRQAISRAVSDQGRTIRLPDYMQNKLYKIAGVTKRLTQKLHRDPTPEEIAVEIPKMTEKKIKYLLEKGKSTLSLQQSMDWDEEIELGDSVPDPAPSPDEQATEQSLIEQIRATLKTIPPREALILQMRFGLNGEEAKSLEKVSQEFGVTRERVRQIESRALSRLRRPSVYKKLRDYLDSD